MNKVGLLLKQLHSAETDLADQFREVGGREAAEQEVYYLCMDLAKQCDNHAAAVRRLGERYGRQISQPFESETLENVMAGLRRRGSYMLGRHPASGLLLLRDLRQLFLMAHEVSLLWVAAGQIAQAARDKEMLDTVSALHKETLTQIKWLKTKIRQTSPQVLLTG